METQEQLTFGALGLTLGGILIKGVPATFKWFTGNLDADKLDKFKVMQSWIEQLQKDTEEARRTSQEALKAIQLCEDKHSETFKAMYEDRIKYERQMSKLEAQLEHQNGLIQTMQIGMQRGEVK
jgi:hypothetical protein